MSWSHGNVNMLAGHVAVLVKQFFLAVYIYKLIISDLERVNYTRKWLFTKKSRTLKNIPPTQATLKQHVKRASYQANCENKALFQNPELPKINAVFHNLYSVL